MGTTTDGKFLSGTLRGPEGLCALAALSPLHLGVAWHTLRYALHLCAQMIARALRAAGALTAPLFTSAPTSPMHTARTVLCT